MRLLLIEDDQDIASFITSGLRETGYAVDSALNGTEGNTWHSMSPMMSCR